MVVVGASVVMVAAVVVGTAVVLTGGPPAKCSGQVESPHRLQCTPNIRLSTPPELVGEAVVVVGAAVVVVMFSHCSCFL